MEHENNRPKNGELKNYAYEKIKEKIIDCAYAPGSVLSEQRLTDELKLGRTPIREALMLIEQEGFIRILPKKGVIVCEISISDIVQIFDAREEIEPVIVKLAGPNLDRDILIQFQTLFESTEAPTVCPAVLPASQMKNIDLDMQMHLFFANSCNNKFLVEMMYKIFDHNKRVITSTNQGARLHDARLEHLEVIRWTLERDYLRAAQAMRTHIKSCKEAAFHFYMSGNTGF